MNTKQQQPTKLPTWQPTIFDIFPELDPDGIYESSVETIEPEQIPDWSGWQDTDDEDDPGVQNNIANQQADDGFFTAQEEHEEAMAAIEWLEHFSLTGRAARMKPDFELLSRITFVSCELQPVHSQADDGCRVYTRGELPGYLQRREIIEGDALNVLSVIGESTSIFTFLTPFLFSIILAFMRIGIYARVSTHDQQTLPMQLERMREYIERRE